MSVHTKGISHLEYVNVCFEASRYTFEIKITLYHCEGEEEILGFWDIYFLKCSCRNYQWSWKVAIIEWSEENFGSQWAYIQYMQNVFNHVILTFCLWNDIFFTIDSFYTILGHCQSSLHQIHYIELLGVTRFPVDILYFFLWNQTLDTSSYKQKQEAKGAWRSAQPFARWKQHSFMDDVNVGEVTYNQSVIYIF